MGKVSRSFEKVSVHRNRKEIIVAVGPLQPLLREEGGPAKVAPGARALSRD